MVQLESLVIWGLILVTRKAQIQGFSHQLQTLCLDRSKPVSAKVSSLGLAAGEGDHYPPNKCVTKKYSYTLKKPLSPSPSPRWSLRRLFGMDRSPQGKEDIDQELNFSYEYDELEVGKANKLGSSSTIGVVLIHPIGVGIGRWFHQRLTDAVSSRHDNERAPCHLVVVSPDLLGSGSACNPKSNDGQELQRLPLLNVSDWTDQIDDLMERTENLNEIDRWCVVANGGCSPIALQVAQRSVERTASFQKNVTNVILSSVPRLPFFLLSSDPQKVLKAYKRLCGVLGKVFWWYSCRNKGAFIQKFSEKNLVADPENLGDRWRPNCYATAKMNGGKSKYSTFAFLAGTLQDGCRESLDALKNTNIRIDIIKGRDVRRNQAKSWFWQKPKRKPGATEEHRKTFRDLVIENDNGGRETLIGGRVSLAHEDAEGYSDAILEYLVTG
jgi:hypothetical protein